MSGEDLRLTIDAGLQLSVEQELLAAYIADAAKSVSAVVMDPYTGEVYAEASYPSYDANDYRAVAAKTPGRFVDPMVSSVYEPGSVFKFMTATAALELGTVTTTPGSRTPGRSGSMAGGPRSTTPTEGDGLDDVRGRRRLLAQRHRLEGGAQARPYDQGLGGDPARDVAAPGLRRQDRHGRRGRGQRARPRSGHRPWAQIDLANGSFGQGVAITPIQLATAYAALMNGGLLIHPHVVQALGDRDVPVAPGSRLIDAGLSHDPRPADVPRGP